MRGLAVIIGGFAIPAWGYRLDSDLAKLTGAPLGLMVVPALHGGGRMLRRSTQKLLIGGAGGPMRTTMRAPGPHRLLRGLEVVGTASWALFAALAVLDTPIWAGAAAGATAGVAFFVGGYYSADSASSGLLETPEKDVRL